MGPRLALVALATLLSVLAGCRRKGAADPNAALTFVAEGKPPVTLPLDALTEKIAPEEVRGWDPYYRKDKRFRALPLARVLAVGFARGDSFERDEFVFRATDGYAAYFRGALAMEDGAYLAVEDLDVPGWEPIGPQHANPGPFYVVWKKSEQADLESHPRPWQLQRIELVRFETAYPHTRPADGDAAAARGYAIFRERCFKCHAMNREGGHVGPELNVPQNILEYRPEAQVRAYIRNPASFRYGNMPPHVDFTEADFDALIAYLRSMKDRKHDQGQQ